MGLARRDDVIGVLRRTFEDMERIAAGTPGPVELGLVVGEDGVVIQSFARTGAGLLERLDAEDAIARLRSENRQLAKDLALAEAASLKQAERRAELVDRNYEIERDLYRVTGGRPICGPSRLFKRRPPRQYDERIGTVQRGMSTDTLVVTFTMSGFAAGAAGKNGFIPGDLECRLRRDVQADSWWHLCAIEGIPEWMARLLFVHPEEGQESATAEVPPIDPKRTVARREPPVVRYSEED